MNSATGDLLVGTTLIFRVYGLVCGVVLVLFFVLNFYNISEGKFTTDLPEDLDPRNVRNFFRRKDDSHSRFFNNLKGQCQEMNNFLKASKIKSVLSV
jgi:hypothetical protein